MKKLLNLTILAFAFGLIFTGVQTANAQNKEIRKARKEYRKDVREARKDYRKDIRQGDNRRDARRDYRDDVRDARRDYRQDTGRRVNQGNWNRGRTDNTWNKGRYDKSRYYYRNGRRYSRNN